MRDSVKQVLTEETITLTQLAVQLKISSVLAHRLVVDEQVCDHVRIGRNHVVLDRQDIPLVEERIARSSRIKTPTE